MDRFNVGPFEVTVLNSGITVRREEGSVSYQPGEGATAISLLLQVMSVETLKRLPPRLRHTPFEVTFSKERVMELHREEETLGVAFVFKEGDDFIEAFKQGLNKYTDMLTIQGGAKPGHSSMFQPDPIVEGR